MTAIEKGLWEIRREELEKIKKKFEYSTRIITHFYQGKPVEEEVGDEKGASLSVLASFLLHLEERLTNLEKSTHD